MRQVRTRRAGGNHPADPRQSEAGSERGADEQRRLAPGEILEGAHQAAKVIGAQRIRQGRKLVRAALDEARDPVLMPFQLLARAMHRLGHVIQPPGQALLLSLSRGGRTVSHLFDESAAAGLRFLRQIPYLASSLRTRPLDLLSRLPQGLTS